jgi:hypothetical protein
MFNEVELERDVKVVGAKADASPSGDRRRIALQSFITMDIQKDFEVLLMGIVMSMCRHGKSSRRK